MELVSNDRKFEVGELCRLFVHPWIGHIYDVIVVVSGFIILWMYSSQAASSLSSEIPFSGKIFEQCDGNDYFHKLRPDGNCWNTYSLCVIFYGIIVVPLSCLNLRWQIIFQTIMGIFRIIVIVSMSIYSFAGAMVNVHSGTNISSALHNVNDTQAHIWFHFDFRRGFGVIPVTTFALLVHFMIPTFCKSVIIKEHLKRIFTIGLSLATFLYVLVGVTVAMFYGRDVYEICTLTWVSPAYLFLCN